MLATAVLIGGACNMVMQWTWSARKGYILLPTKPDPKNAELRETLRLFVPYAAGLSLNQINPVISRMLGSFLEGGIISVLNYADRIIQLPLGLFVIAISQAVLPMLSSIDRGDEENFQAFIRDALRFNLFVVLPAALSLVVVARPVVHILLVRGAFGDWAWHATTGALACYAIGLPGMACNTVVMRALYARSMPKAAVSVTLFTVSANLVLGLLLMRPLSHMGLAIGTSCAFTGAAFLGAWLLSRDIGRRIGIFGIGWTIRQSLCCVLFTGGLYFITSDIPYPVALPFGQRAIWMIAVILMGMLLYTAITLFLRCPEWGWIREALVRKTGKAQKNSRDEVDDI